jgi:hypothetical protein
VFCLAARDIRQHNRVCLVGGAGPGRAIESAEMCVWFVLGRGTSGRGGLWTAFCLRALGMRQQSLVGEWWVCVRLRAL